jgi:hypothetical protein
VLDRGYEQCLRACGEKIAASFVGLEAYQIGTQDTVEYFFPGREHFEDAAFGERCMQEPAHGDFDIQFLGSLPEHEVVVMHPDVITVSQMGHDCVCKCLVRFAIRRHGVQVETDSVGLVVEQWPDCGSYHQSISISTSGVETSMHTREAIVVEFGGMLVKQYRNGVVIFRETPLQFRNVVFGNLKSRPAKPEEVDTTVCEPSESCD